MGVKQNDWNMIVEGGGRPPPGLSVLRIYHIYAAGAQDTIIIAGQNMIPLWEDD